MAIIYTKLKNNPNEATTQSLFQIYKKSEIENLKSRLLEQPIYDKRYYSAILETLQSHLKMAAKREIIPSNHALTLKNVIETLKTDVTNNNIDLTEFDNSSNVYEQIKNVIIQRVNKESPREGQDFKDSIDYLYLCISQQEQEATASRIWTRSAIEVLDTAVQDLQSALLDKAEANVKTVMPSYMYHQTAQIGSLGHYLLSFVEMFGRDRDRLNKLKERVNLSPLGSYMGNGTSFKIAPNMTQRSLDFTGICANSLDAITDRDFIIDFLSALAVCGTHMYKFCSDLLHWQHPNSNFISFSSHCLTNDELTDHPRYPQIIDLILSKTSVLNGNLMTVLSLLRSNNSTKALSEAIEPAISSCSFVLNALKIISALAVDFNVNQKRMKEKSQVAYAFAYDIRDYLVQRLHITPKEASKITKKILDKAIETDTKLSLLEREIIQEIDARLVGDVVNDLCKLMISSHNMASRKTQGGTSPVEVRKKVRIARRKFLN